MKYRLWFYLFLATLAVAISLFPAQHIASESDPVLIGVLHSEKYTYATMMRNSHDMALEVINNSGGIQGRPLKLVYADDRGERKAGEKAVKELARNSGAVMLVGGYQSSNTVYTAGMADKLDMPFLINTAADDRITQRKWKNVYRMNPPSQEYAKGVEDLLLKKIKPSSMAIIYENSPYGTGGALRMMWFCRENDIAIRKIIPYHKERASPEYFHKLLGPVQEAPPDVIYMVSYLKDAVILVKKIRELPINSLLIGGAGGFTSIKFIENTGEGANTVLTATLWSPQVHYPGTKEYYSGYRKKYNSAPDYHGAEAYSALLVAADVLNRAVSFSPEDIRTALDKTDLVTPFGPVKFKSYGIFERQNSLPTMVLQVFKDTFETVWPEDIATSSFIPPPEWRKTEKKTKN